MEKTNKTLEDESKKLSKDKYHVGGIAQQIRKSFPHCVNGSDDSVLSVNWTNMVPFLIKSIQDIDFRLRDVSDRLSFVERLVKPGP